MAQQYLLPCDCGAKLVVEVAQSGEITTCECGASIEIPTLSKLRQLDRVEEQPSGPVRKRAGWGRSQAILFTVGLFVMTAALVAAGFCWYQRREIDISENDQTMEEDHLKHLNRQSPTQLFDMWTRIREQGLKKVREQPLPEYVLNQQQYDTLTWAMQVAAAIAACGLIMTCISLVARPRVSI